MDSELQRYDKYYSAVKLMLLLSGIWPEQKISKAYRIFVLAYVVFYLICVVGMMLFVYHNITNLGLLTTGLGPTVSGMSGILKVFIFSYCQRTLCELHTTLDTGFQKDLNNPVLQPIVLSLLKNFYKPTMWLIYSTWSLVTIYNLSPIISIIVQRLHNAATIKLRTPYPTKFPWSYDNRIGLYLLQYGNDVCTCVTIGTITCGTDALFGFYIFQMASQFRTLSYRMKNLKSSDDYRSVIKECHERTLMLERCRNQLQTIYGPIVLWMLTTSAISICANVFQASQMSIAKTSKVLVYIIVKLIQMLLYGWYGLFLTIESEAFRYSIYNSGWTSSGDKKFLTNILTMSMYKPLVLKACHVSVISLDMFVAVTNTAISYFFMLRTLDEK